MGGLLSGDSLCWSSDDVENVLFGMYELASQLYVARGRAILKAGVHGFAAGRGALDLAGWLREQMQVAPGDARRQTVFAEAVIDGPCRATGVALIRGRISPEQAEVIVRAVQGFPEQFSVEQRRSFEAALLVDAARKDRFQLTRAAAQMMDELLAASRPPSEEGPEADSSEDDRRGTSEAGSSTDDGNADGGGGKSGAPGAADGGGPAGTDGCSAGEGDRDAPAAKGGDLGGEGAAPRRDPQAARQLTFIDTPQGTTLIRGELDPEAAALLRTALDGLCAPRPGEAGVRDLRSPARRRVDALVELVNRALSAGRVPKAGGTRPHLTVTIPWAALIATGLGPAMTSWGMPLPREVIRRIACDAAVSRIIPDPEGVPLDVGRTVRTVPPHIRRSLVVRDEGCAFPGCDRPSSWTEAHHIVHWLDNGETKIDNMVLLCAFHHHRVHREKWDILVEGGRRPSFVPPANIDPLRRPRRNIHSQSSPDLFSRVRS